MEKTTEAFPTDRPREKLFKYGPSYLSNEELIAVLLGSGSRGNDVFCISKKVMGYLEENVSTVRENFTSFSDGLLKIKGLGAAKAALIAASCELQSRLTGDQKRIIKNAVDILPYISYLATKRQEYFVCINLNGGNRVMSNRVVTIGLIDQALVHPREVFSEAVKEKAAKVIVAHNHPAGNSAPSNEDVEITNNLVRASGILGITFLDHIIITDDGYFSFREDGLL
jgi:DNA repair protein RadC